MTADGNTVADGIFGSAPPSFYVESGDLVSVYNQIRPAHAFVRREDAPWLFDQYYDGASKGLFTRYNDVTSIVRGDDHFVNRSDIHPTRRLGPEDTDKPEHTRLRKLLTSHFSANAVSAFEPRLVAFTNALIDDFIDRGEVSVNAFAERIPEFTFMLLLDLAPGDMPEFRSLLFQVFDPPGDSLEEKMRSSVAIADQLYEFFGRFVDRKYANPTDDVLSKLCHQEVNSDRLSRDEILDFVYLLSLAGLGTVKGAIELFFLHLARNPKDRAYIIQADDRALALAIEELIRVTPPISNLRRVASQDVEVAGCPVHAGQKVSMSIVSANYDPEVFENPDTVDLARQPNPHMSFGGGIHRCLGNHLTRLELRVALREWHRRIPEYRVREGDKPMWENHGGRSVPNLNLTFPVGEAAARSNAAAGGGA